MRTTILYIPDSLTSPLSDLVPPTHLTLSLWGLFAAEESAETNNVRPKKGDECGEWRCTASALYPRRDRSTAVQAAKSRKALKAMAMAMAMALVTRE